MPISKDFIIIMGILIFLTLAMICGTVEKIILGISKHKSDVKCKQFEIEKETQEILAKYGNSETAQMEDEKDEQN